MKITNQTQMVQKAAWLFLASATISINAAVTYVGDDDTTDSKWRTTSVVKANDMDGDNVYGTAGYYFPRGLAGGYSEPWMPLGETNIAGAWNTQDLNTMPAWFQGLVVTNAGERLRSWGGDGGNFGNLDNVGGGHTGWAGGPVLLGGDYSPSGRALGLLLKRTASPAFRLTLIVGNSQEGAPFTVAQTVTVDDGSGPVTQAMATPTFAATGKTSYQSWDISAGSSDIFIELSDPSVTALVRIAGLAVDTSAVVEPSITGQPSGGVFLVGADVKLTGVVAGTAPQIQWYKDSATLPDQTNSVLSISPISLADDGSYRFVATNAAGSVTSAVAVVSVTASIPSGQVAYSAAVTAQPSVISYYPFNLQTTGDVVGANDGTSLGVVAYGTSQFGGATKTVTIQGGQIDMGNVAAFQFADGTGTVEMMFRCGWTGPTPGGSDAYLFSCQDSTNGNNFSVAVPSGRDAIRLRNGTDILNVSSPLGTNWHHLAVIFNAGVVTVVLNGQVVENTFALGGAAANFQVGSSTPGDGGNTRWVGDIDEVAIYSGALTTNVIQNHFELSQFPAVINTQPVGVIAVTGETIADLTVAASGPGLRYQWYKDNSPVLNATNSSFTFGGVASPAQNGNYIVIVTNSFNSVTSSIANVFVYTPAVQAYKAAVSAQPGLLSLYNFDTEDTNTTTVVDVVRGTNGVINGTSTYSAGLGGGTNRAFAFDGFSWIQFGNVPEFAFTNKVGSIELLVRNTSSSPAYSPTIMSYREDGSGGTVYSLHASPNARQLVMWNGSGAPSANGSTADQGWHHYVVVFGDGGTTNTQFYLDGVRIASIGNYGPGNGDPATVTAQLGSSQGTFAGEAWIGALDEVAYYSTALTYSDVVSHFYALAGISIPSVTIAESGSDVILSWASGTSGWILETSSTLNGGSWTNLGSITPVSVAKGAGNSFFRLRKL